MRFFSDFRPWLWAGALWLGMAHSLQAQTEAATAQRIAVSDTVMKYRALPFPISAEKQLTPGDILNKKEGWFVTGLPEPRLDPIKGFGIGTHIFLFNNRSRQDPFFNYTPYRERYGLSIRWAENGQFRVRLSADLPFLLDTKWRLRGNLVFERDPNWQYFGLGASSLSALSFTDKTTGRARSFTRFDNYARNLALLRADRGADFGEPEAGLYTDVHYNEFRYQQYLGSVAAERTLFDGRMRLMVGYELLFTEVERYDGEVVSGAVDPATDAKTDATQGRSRLTEDAQNINNNFWRENGVTGLTGGRIAQWQSGIMWDTRDLEPDPTRGVFLEYAQEFSNPLWGSAFKFSKHLLHGMYFYNLWPERLGRTVLAARMGLGTIRGSQVPFTEFLDVWNSYEVEGIKVLGGDQSLRGYREYRFTGNTYGWGNLELRARVWQVRFWRQHLAFGVVPFYDFGRVWDAPRQIRLRGFKTSPGIGGRLAWNQSTIVRFDYATSEENDQFFFTFEHAF